MRLTTIGTLSVTTPSRGTSTSRPSLPRMRNLPKSTGTLPPCRVDLAVGRHLVEGAAAVAVVGPLRRDGHAAAGLVATRRGAAAAAAGQRQDQREQHEQH